MALALSTANAQVVRVLVERIGPAADESWTYALVDAIGAARVAGIDGAEPSIMRSRWALQAVRGAAHCRTLVLHRDGLLWAGRADGPTRTEAQIGRSIGGRRVVHGLERAV